MKCAATLVMTEPKDDTKKKTRKMMPMTIVHIEQKRMYRTLARTEPNG